MVKMFGTGPIFDSMGLINTIYSYVDEIAISFTSDRNMMPDPDVYASALRESFAELLAAAKAGPVPVVKPKAPAPKATAVAPPPKAAPKVASGAKAKPKASAKSTSKPLKIKEKA